jgi:malate dehydrogenase
MSRDDLLSINSNIVKSVTKELVKYSPDTILIIVSNPLDVMVQVAKDASGLPHEKVMGMAGILDTARYRAFIAEEINVSPKDIQAMLMGGHGDTMVPLPRFTTVSGLPISHFISDERLNEIVERAKKGGGELVGLMGTSAWYAPGTAAAQMVEAILLDQDRIFPVCAHLDGQYGIDNLYIGVPVKLGKGGIKEVIEVALTNDEQELLNSSAKHVRGTLDAFNALMDK